MANKKFTLLFLLYFVHSQMAHAFVPVVVVAYVAANQALVSAITGSLALHMGILAIVFNNKTNAALTNAETAPLTVMLNPQAPLPVPSGWAAPVAPAVHPVPPSATVSVISFRWSCTRNDVSSPACVSTTDSDYVAQCNAAGQAIWGDPTRYQIRDITATKKGCGTVTSPSLLYTFISSSFTTCPSGYTASGSNCLLSDAALVPKPANNNCTYLRVGNTWEKDTRDPECNDTQKGVSGSGGTISVIGDGATTTMVINADGSARITEKYPDSATNTTRTIVTDVSAPAGDGTVTVTGTSSSSTVGTGTQETATSSPPVDSSAAFISADNAARAAAVAAASAITAQDVLNNAAAVGSAAAITVAGQASDTNAAAIAAAVDGALSGVAGDESTINAFFAWTPPGAAACVPLSGTVRGNVITWDLCPTIENIKLALGWIMGVFTLIMLFSLVTRKGA